jgi:hypothetical protein
MTSINLKAYNTKIFDFEWFFLSHEKELLDQLYDVKLIQDKTLKNIDTKKIFHKFLIEKILETVHNSDKKVVFIIKPEIICNNREIFKYFDKRKIRKEFINLIKFLVKNKFNIFIFMKKSYSNIENTLDITSPDVRDFIDLYIVKSEKKLFSKIYTINSLTNKMFKQINK